MQSRNQWLSNLESDLTLREAVRLVAKVHERESTTTKGKRFGMHPITDHGSFQRTKRLEASFWTANEVDFREDLDDFESLTADERRPLLLAFGFFAVGDGSVASMLAFQLILLAETFEQQAFYIAQLDNERVHGETYSNMISTLVTDPTEQDSILNAVDTVKSIGRMNEYVERSFMDATSQKQVYVSLAATEYVLFQPLFCIIFWYRAYKPNMLKQIIFSNELIAKDEAAHCENGCENYKRLDDRYSDDEAHKIVDEVVRLVDGFSDELCESVSLPELTPANIKRYTRYVADDLFARLGHAPYYRVTSPFPWMDFTTLIPKTNFYESTVGEYSRFNVANALGDADPVVNAYTDEIKF